MLVDLDEKLGVLKQIIISMNGIRYLWGIELDLCVLLNSMLRKKCLHPVLDSTSEAVVSVEVHTHSM